MSASLSRDWPRTGTNIDRNRRPGPAEFGTKGFERRIAITALVSAAMALVIGAAAMVLSLV